MAGRRPRSWPTPSRRSSAPSISTPGGTPPEGLVLRELGDAIAGPAHAPDVFDHKSRPGGEGRPRRQGPRRPSSSAPARTTTGRTRRRSSWGGDALGDGEGRTRSPGHRHRDLFLVLRRRLAAEFLGSGFLAAIVIGSGYRRAAPVPRLHGPGVAGECGGDGGWAVRHHLDVRPRLRRSFQSGRLLCGDAAFGGLRWREAAACLPAQAAGLVGGAVAANLMFAQGAVENISAKHRA